MGDNGGGWNASQTREADQGVLFVLLDGESLEDVDKFKYLGSMFAANGQGTEEIRSRINLARSTFSRLQSCLTHGVKYRCVQRAGSTRQ